MTSIAEQLSSNFDPQFFKRARALRKRLVFTLLALIVYRFGTYIPLPGVDISVMADIAKRNATGVLGMIDMFAGGALWRMTIFSLNIMPYISASIVVQLLVATTPSLQHLRKDGETGKQKINQYTRYGALGLALVQSYGLAKALESSGVAVNSGFFFELTTMCIIAGSTMFLIWLGDQITSRGVGNGVSMLVFAGIVANLPESALKMLTLGREGHYHALFILLVILGLGLLITFIVFMERAQRRIPMHYPKNQTPNAGGNYLPLKLNNAGVMPPIFASSILLAPVTVSSFGLIENDTVGGIWSSIVYYLTPGNPIHMALYSALLIFFAYFYTALTVDPSDTANNLKKSGAFIPGIRPGNATADYLEGVLTRLTAIGSAYLVSVCIIPEIIKSKYTIPFYFSGTSLLIVVSVVIDLISQIYAHLVAYQYESLMKKDRRARRK
ncbi:MAG: preprotein translocase subunit SecY [Alphaproteobacteria bacterium]|nr:preprotein translocase subunit SecY [Alphaproteobacteria bacterium]